MLDAGRGESADKPFATLQAAINYVAANYNLNTYDATINIAEGYSSNLSIELQAFSTVSGGIVISGPSQDHPEYVTIGKVYLQKSAFYTLKNLTIIPRNNNVFWQAVLVENGQIDLTNVVVDISNTIISNGTLSALYTEKNGIIRVYAVNDINIKCGIIIKVSKNIESTGISLLRSSGGEIVFAADITVQGNCEVTQFAYAENTGLINRVLSSFVNPGRFPVITATGTITGKRYQCSRNGIIVTQGGGEEFFPGTIAGVTASGGQYA